MAEPVIAMLKIAAGIALCVLFCHGVRLVHLRLLARQIAHGARIDSGRECGMCGYDLTGVPEGRPCPECGAERGEGGSAG